MDMNFNIAVYEIAPNDSRAQQPDAKVELKDHQLALLQKCLEFEANRIHLNRFDKITKKYPFIGDEDYMHTNVGIIGDKVGAGKSFVVLALAASRQSNEGRQLKLHTYGNNKVIMHTSDQSVTYNTSILVIPHLLCNQWKSYIAHFSDKIKFALVNNVRTFEPFRKNANTINDYNLILITASMHNSFANLLAIHHITVQRVFYDEVDSMNIPNSLEIPSRFCWFVTASYGNLIYPSGFRSVDERSMRCVYHATGIRNNGYIKNLFMDLTALNREFMNILILKNEDKFVDSCFQISEPLVRMVLCKEPNTIHVLNGLVDRNVMECLNAGDERSAIELIDSRRRHSEDHIVNILIQRYTDDMHNLNVQYQAVSMMTYTNPADKENRLARMDERRVELNRKIQSIRDRITNTMVCPICFDDVTNKTVSKCCSNIFCFSCIHVWINLNSKCPLCKSSLMQKDIYVVDGSRKTSDDLLPPENLVSDRFDKIKNLLIIINNRAPGSKFLIFSNYDNSFYKIAEQLTQQSTVRHAYLKGNKFHVQQKLNEFREGNLDVLLVNATNYGSGLNLENTTDVIMFHKCDSEVEKQVIGRAQRAGRKTKLNLWFLLHNNEMRQTTA